MTFHATNAAYALPARPMLAAFDNGAPPHDYEQAAAYVTALTGQDANPAIVDIRLLHDTDKKSPAIPMRGTLPQLWPQILHYQSQGFGAFINVNEMDGVGRELPNVASCRAQCIDLDNLSAQQNYDRAAQWTPLPSFAVQSSPGRFHVYWQIEPHRDLDRFTLIQRKLRHTFDSDPAVSDPTRLLRLPGTLHLKDPDKPSLVTCWQLGGFGQRYSPEALEAALQGITVLDGGNGVRHELGDPSLAAPSLDALDQSLKLIDPNTLPRDDWIATLAAAKQAAWTHATPDEIDAILMAWCARYEHDDIGEDRKQIASIRTTEIGWPSILRRVPEITLGPGGNVPAQLPTGMSLTPVAPRQSTAGTITTDYSDICARPRVIARPLISGVLPADGVGMIYGAPKAGKTFITLDLALAVATGTQWQNRAIKRNAGPVIYIAGEGHKGLRYRVEGWEQDRQAKIEAGRIRFTDRAINFGDASALEALKNELTALPLRPSLIVIDTLFRATVGANVSDQQEMSKFWSICENMQRYFNCTVLVVHHTNKSETQTSFGSIVAEASIDFQIAVEWDRQKDQRVMRSQLTKDSEPFDDYHFKLKPVTTPLVRYDDGEQTAITSCVPEYIEVAETDDRDRKTSQRVKEDVPQSPTSKPQRNVGSLICAIYDLVLERKGIAKTSTVHDDIAIPKDLLRKYFSFDKDGFHNGLRDLGSYRNRGPREPWINATGDKKYTPKSSLLAWARDENYCDFDNLEISDADFALITGN